jgi:predicted glycosyltransferase
VPIIAKLRLLGHSVAFAGNEWQRNFINETFEGIETIHLDGYDVTYSKRGSGFLFSLFYQMPRLVRTIRKEHEWLNNLTQERQFDGIISDNRYGLFHTQIPSVMMTHQLLAQSGMGEAADQVLKRIHYKYIQRFRNCWVVDVAGVPNLSGKLAHPGAEPTNARYIGLLSQIAEEATRNGEEKHLLVLLSGPEPQRSILSGMLWEQVKGHHEKVVFVEGSNAVERPATIPDHIQYHKQVTKKDLLPLLQRASLVVCRSGYSTIMDLVALNKKAILIPTPGQTEQEYLGRHLHKEGLFYSVPQKRLDLEQALQDVKLFPFRELELRNAHKLYHQVLEQWVKGL